MFKYTSTYKDWNGVKRTEDFYFHLTEADIAELQLSKAGGFAEYVSRLTKAKDSNEAETAFKKIILISYGEKSEDGRYFVKDDEVVKRFKGSPVYSELYMRMVRDVKFAIKFFNGILPESMQRNETEIYKTTKELESDLRKASEEINEPSGVVSETSEEPNVQTDVVEN